LVPEGIEGRIPYKGTIEEVMIQYLGGLRAGMGYIGAKDIQSISNAECTIITNAGRVESHPHDVAISKEAQNYKSH